MSRYSSYRAKYRRAVAAEKKQRKNVLQEISDAWGELMEGIDQFARAELARREASKKALAKSINTIMNSKTAPIIKLTAANNSATSWAGAEAQARIESIKSVQNILRKRLGGHINKIMNSK